MWHSLLHLYYTNFVGAGAETDGEVGVTKKEGK